MKQLILTFLTGLLVSALHGQDKPLVMASASMWADMTETLAGELVDVQTIVPIGGDPHIYDPTPDDARRVEQADLILLNGLTFEGWIQELIDNSGTKADVVLITQGVSAIQSTEYANSFDPHAWMDPTLGLIYIQNIYQALVQLLPNEKDVLTYNYELYRSQLQDLDTYVKKEIEKIPADQRFLITSHDAFQYYGRKYGLQLEGVLGTSTEAEVQTSDIREIETLLQKHPIPALFIESTINPKLIQQLADDNNVIIGGQLYADSLSDEDGPAGTYINMIKHNTDVIVQALMKKKPVAENPTSTPSYWWILAIVALLAILVFFLLKRNG